MSRVIGTGGLNRGTRAVGGCVCGGSGACPSCVSAHGKPHEEEFGRRRGVSTGRGRSPRFGRPNRVFRRRPPIAFSQPTVIHNTNPEPSWLPVASVAQSTAPASVTAPTLPAGMPQAASTDLVLVATDRGNAIRLQRRVATSWSRLVAEARRQGIAAPLLTLRAGSTTTGRQQSVWKRAVQVYGSEDEARLWCVTPGTASARDGVSFEVFLGTPTPGNGQPKARTLPAYRWLRSNARRFGFVPHGRSAGRWAFAGGASDAWDGREVNEVAEGLAAASLGVGAASLGVAVFTLQSLKGSTNFSSDVGEYRHTNTPANLPWYLTEYEFTIEARTYFDVGSPEYFRFVVSFEHNSYDLRLVQVLGGSDPLLMSKMNVNFKMSPLSEANAVQLSMVVNISGTWDPVGPGEYPFSNGQLSVDAAGNCKLRRTIYQAEEKVALRALRKLKTVRLGGDQPQPPGPAPTPGGGGACARRTDRNCSGPVVVDLQQRLNRWLSSRGMALIDVDGLWTSKTASAVVAFKRAHGLTPADAVAGPKTWSLLRKRY